MREYRFRGKTKATGEWVYGDLLHVDNRMCIIPNINVDDIDVCTLEVDLETVGQYIGLHDKSGKEIYEGDIVKLCDTNPILFRVEIILARYGYKTVFKLLDDGTIAQCYFLDKCEVVGNIHDNPELLMV